MNTVHESPRVVAAGQRPSGTEGSREAARDGDEFFEAALAAMPQHPDWERLIEEGTMPSLVLGAERRLDR